MNPMQTRWMIRRDLDEVLRIEFECYSQPLSKDELLGELRQRNVIGMVFEHNRDLIGYMLYALHKSRLEILRFAVLPQFQRQGCGTAMMTRLVNKLSQQRRKEIDVTVSERATDGHLFLRACGFKAFGVERDFFRPGHDGYRFQYLLPVAAEAAIS